MPRVEVDFYDLPDGTYPAEEFLESLDIKMQAKMVRTIKMFEENGTDLRKPYSEYLRDGIFELRVKVGSNISRVMYFFFDGGKAILTHGFIKKTQKHRHLKLIGLLSTRMSISTGKGGKEDEDI